MIEWDCPQITHILGGSPKWDDANLSGRLLSYLINKGILRTRASAEKFRLQTTKQHTVDRRVYSPAGIVQMANLYHPTPVRLAWQFIWTISCTEWDSSKCSAFVCSLPPQRHQWAVVVIRVIANGRSSNISIHFISIPSAHDFSRNQTNFFGACLGL